MPRLLPREYLGLFLTVVIGALAIFGFFGGHDPSRTVRGAPATHTLTVSSSNAIPAVSAVSVNHATSIVLTANATTAVVVNFNVSDTDGCGDVFTSGNVTTTLFRSGVSSTCGVENPTVNNLNCYIAATTTNDCSGGSNANATATFDVWYFAQATDVSSSFPSEFWQAFVSVRDAANATSATSSAGTGGSADTGLMSPSSAGEDYNQWLNALNATTSNNAYATNGFTDGVQQDYYDFNFGVPAGATVNGIEVKVEAKGGSGVPTLYVDASWDGGATYTSFFQHITGLTTSDVVYTVGSSTDLWGHAWSSDQLGNGNFRLLLTADDTGAVGISVDQIQARVYYTAVGGTELNTLLALNVTTSSINYGTLSASSTSGAVNQVTTSTNAGNSSSSLSLSVFSTLVSGSNILNNSSNTTQTYSTSTFTFQGTSTFLTTTITPVVGFFLTSPTSSTNNVQQPVYWGIQVLAGNATGTYTGVNLFTAVYSP